MGQAAPRRIDHCLTAGAVLLAHLVVAWIVIQMHAAIRTELPVERVVIAQLIEPPPHRILTVGAVPIPVKMEGVVHLEKLAPPAIPEIPVEIPNPPVPTDAISVGQPGSNGLEGGTALAEAGHDSNTFYGGGRAITLLKRVVPRYPQVSADLEEQGNTSVRIRVTESGRVAEVKVTHSSGSRYLDGAAVTAVRKWQFAPVPSGSAPDGTWVDTELRFVLYQFTYSRIGEGAADRVYGEQVKDGAKDVPTPGSQEAFTRFIAEVKAGTFEGLTDAGSRDEVAKMRQALDKWGDVQSIQFIGTAGARRWMTYEIPTKTGESYHAVVDVSWNMFEVRHPHAKSAWLIAVGRDGTIWNARASPAPWL